MPYRLVQSKNNTRLKELRQTLAHPGRNSHGLAGIEGPNLLAEALRAGLRIDSVFVAQGTEYQLEALPLPPETEILLMPRDLLEAALDTETPQPVAALVEAPEWSWAHVLGENGERTPLIIVLAGLQDPGNLGTILRSAEAFGATGILSLPGSVSSWNAKAVRASAGSIFRLPLLAVTAEECFAHLRDAGVKIWTTAVQSSQPVNEVDMATPIAILIGNEGKGVPAELAALTDGALTIPCPGPVESLNAAVAASVLLYEASRQRAGRSADESHSSQNPRRTWQPEPFKGETR